MMSSGGQERERVPRRGRYLVPRQTPRRSEILAGCYTILLVSHLIAAQLAAVIALFLYGVIRLARLPGGWLVLPLLAGVAWTAAAGPAQVVADHFTAARHILSYGAAVIMPMGEGAGAAEAFAGWPGWLRLQFPLALALGSAEALFATLLAWLHTDEWRVPPARPGAGWMLRRQWIVRSVQGGGVVTKDGACLGVDESSGRPLRVSWREVSGNLLCVGGSDSGKTTTCLQLVYAALRRRKPVVVVDLSGDTDLAGRFQRACRGAGVPSYVFGPAGPCRYDPLGASDPERRKDLVMSLVDWRGTPEQHRRSSARYVADAFAVADAVAGEEPVELRPSMLEELLRLTDPGELRTRAQDIPAYHPQRQALIERAGVSANLLVADPQTVSALAGALRELQASPLARWLGPGEDDATAGVIDVERALRERTAVLFSLDAGSYGHAATGIASVVTRDLVAAAASLREMDVVADGLVWLDEFGHLPEESVHALLARGRDAGLPVLASTRYGPAIAHVSGPSGSPSGSVAGRVVDLVGGYLLHRVNDPDGAEALSRLAGHVEVRDNHVPAQLPAAQSTTAQQPGQRKSARRSEPAADASGSEHRTGTVAPAQRPLVHPGAIQRLANGHFALVLKTPQYRVVRHARTVPVRTLDGAGDENPVNRLAVGPLSGASGAPGDGAGKGGS